jgi:hypothetical protein
MPALLSVPCLTTCRFILAPVTSVDAKSPSHASGRLGPERRYCNWNLTLKPRSAVRVAMGVYEK